MSIKGHKAWMSSSDCQQDMHEQTKELRAAVASAKEENALFKEVLHSIDPRTGRQLADIDPGSLSVARFHDCLCVKHPFPCEDAAGVL